MFTLYTLFFCQKGNTQLTRVCLNAFSIQSILKNKECVILFFTDIHHTYVIVFELTEKFCLVCERSPTENKCIRRIRQITYNWTCFRVFSAQAHSKFRSSIYVLETTLDGQTTISLCCPFITAGNWFICPVF
jgi:hypothetical protein